MGLDHPPKESTVLSFPENLKQFFSNILAIEVTRNVWLF
jgi:hypothetical protein